MGAVILPTTLGNTALLSCKRNDLKFYGSTAVPLVELAFSLGIKEFSWNILLRAPLLWESDQFQGLFSFNAIPLVLWLGRGGFLAPGEQEIP